MRDCHCILCAADAPEPAGFEVVTLTEPPYAHTLGLWHSYGHPEVVLFGVPDAEGRLDKVGVLVAEGRVLPPDQGDDDILGDITAERRPVLATWHRRLFPALLEFYRGQPVPVVQLVVKGGGDQPRLWDRCPGEPAPPGWPFPDPPETVVVATTAAAFDGAPITLVAHDEEGEWQFLGSGTDDLTPVHLAHLLEAHPALADLADLPVGWEATAEGTGPWSRAPAEDD
ncbi:MAG TPA: DUF4262 domain-containing protein [Acidimicrobiia bacterium]